MLSAFQLYIYIYIYVYISELPIKGTFLLKVFPKNKKNCYIFLNKLCKPFEVIFINMKDSKHNKIYFDIMIC